MRSLKQPHTACMCICLCICMCMCSIPHTRPSAYCHRRDLALTWTRYIWSLVRGEGYYGEDGEEEVKALALLRQLGPPAGGARV